MTGSSAFSQTLQFITSVKLQELQHQSQTFSNHADDVINRATMAESDIEKVQELLDGVNAWKGLGGLTTTDIPLDNIQLYVCPSNLRDLTHVTAFFSFQVAPSG